MIMLGINGGHNTTAALMADDTILAALAEASMTCNKNKLGSPKIAIDKYRRVAGTAALLEDVLIVKNLLIHTPTQ